MNCSCSNKWFAFFKAVHDKHRQKILEVIQSNQTINETGIVQKVRLSQPTISHHLKILEAASVIKSKKVGKEVVYIINSHAIDDCCGGFMQKFSKQNS